MAICFSIFVDFAAALANPIAYQSALEKHSQQLAVLEEDFDAPVCTYGYHVATI